MKGIIVRQGDVALKEVSTIPKGLNKKNNVLALGEKTGHSHRFETKQVQCFGELEKESYIDVKQTSELIHEDHANIQVPEGKYQVIIQREFDIVEGVRQVMD